MVELALLGTAALAATAAAVLACLIFFQNRRVASKEALAHMLRSETDLIKSAGEDRARGVRQELTGSLKNFQDATLNAFRTLSEFISTQVRDFGGRLDVGIKTVDQRVEAIAAKLDTDLGQMGAEAHKNRDGLRQLVEAKLDDAVSKQRLTSRELQDALGSSFSALSDRVAHTLTQSSAVQKERLDSTTQALTVLSDRHEKAQETLRQTVHGALDAIRQENSAKLDEMRQTVDEKLQTTLETRLGEAFNRVVTQLSLVYQSIGEMKDLATNVGSLKSALTNVKVRGTFGEVQLSMLLEDFLSPDQYVKDACVKDGTNERVEYAIKFRAGSEGEELFLPVDAKFPREDYDNLIAASEQGDAAQVARFRKQLENRIKTCARDIKEKYINPPRTTEFAILFLPTESLYAEVLRQPGLFDYLQRECRVTLAGPTTFAAILHAFQMNFRSLAIAKRSVEVWHILGAVKTEFSRYNEVVDKIGKQINTAATSVDNLGRRTRAMHRRLKAVEAMPDGTSAQKALGLTPEELTTEDEELDTQPSDVPTELIPERAIGS